MKMSATLGMKIIFFIIICLLSTRNMAHGYHIQLDALGNIHTAELVGLLLGTTILIVSSWHLAKLIRRFNIKGQWIINLAIVGISSALLIIFQ